MRIDFAFFRKKTNLNNVNSDAEQSIIEAMCHVLTLYDSDFVVAGAVFVSYQHVRFDQGLKPLLNQEGDKGKKSQL